MKDVLFNLMLSRQMSDRLTRLSKITGIPKSELVRRGIEKILREYELKTGGQYEPKETGMENLS